MYYNNRKYKRKRLRDFNGRKKYDPGYTFFIDNQIQEYITVHPMANEEELLKMLGITAEDCDKVDCYWNCGKDIIFLEVSSYKLERLVNPGL